jgi:hypothetical protein
MVGEIQDKRFRSDYPKLFLTIRSSFICLKRADWSEPIIRFDEGAGGFAARLLAG